MRELIGNAHCVLFDFDGPICRLFAARPAESVARRLRELAAAIATELGVPLPRLLPEELRASPDPHHVLLGIARRRPGRGVVTRLEAALTREEIFAAGTARPTPYAAALMAALTARGRQVAVVTNNSPLAVEHYLRQHQLSGFVGGRIHGRTADFSRLKPHPDAVLRALASTRTAADAALMIGDAPSDLGAARAAGVAFLGFAPDEEAAGALVAAGAERVVRSLEEVMTALVAPTPGEK
ncbi:HAD family hydrolase [Streptomyces sp. 6N223]|uniref:HAD family hydrolase n=1 Tax=Streptomyces sp. 6N223 TaxID=3457412 RepID=UPI003FD1244D